MENSKKKVLITDDSEINRSILSDMLGEEFEIIEAENGIEAISVLQTYNAEIALVLLDIVMPEMDGFEVLAVMNKNRWIEDTPVIMITAENAPFYVERAYDLGVTDFIPRPFDGRIVVGEHYIMRGIIFRFIESNAFDSIGLDKVRRRVSRIKIFVYF